MVWLDCNIDSVLNEFMKNYSCLGILKFVLKSRLWLYEKMSFIYENKKSFPHQCFALSLTLKQRLEATQKDHFMFL